MNFKIIELDINKNYKMYIKQEIKLNQNYLH